MGASPILAFPLRAERTAASLARRRIMSALVMGDEVLEDLRLVVTELVTNAVMHAGLGQDDILWVRLWRNPASLHVEVEDPGRGFAESGRRPAARSDHGGRGLALIERLSSRSGRQENPTIVWAELAIPPGSIASRAEDGTVASE
jgi:anti-sigma regulatory factor (Ser/Thr protein kinase)